MIRLCTALSPLVEGYLRVLRRFCKITHALTPHTFEHRPSRSPASGWQPLRTLLATSNNVTLCNSYTNRYILYIIIIKLPDQAIASTPFFTKGTSPVFEPVTGSLGTTSSINHQLDSASDPSAVTPVQCLLQQVTCCLSQTVS
jgi:hypothetical protein